MSTNLNDPTSIEAAMSCRGQQSHWLNRILKGGAICAGVTLICLLGIGLMRGQTQQNAINALLKFDVSIEAQFSPYTDMDSSTNEIEDPPSKRVPEHFDANRAIVDNKSRDIQWENNTISLKFGGGQRSEGFSVVGERSQLFELMVPILGERRLTRVIDIEISDYRFSDADVDLLLSFHDLRALDVSRTAITDDGLMKLEHLNQLRILNVSDTQVTTKSLARFKQLKELTVTDIAADDEDLRELQRLLPNCEIYH